MSRALSRRDVLRAIIVAGAASASGMGSRAAWAQRPNGQPNGQEKGEMRRISNQFARQFSVPALSIAITRNGQFVYDEAHGMADKDKAIQVSETSLFRIASLSKPFTSVTIFRLIEQGRLHLNDKVFGPGGVLGERYGRGPYRQYVTDITLDHLLTHTAGGWANDSTDPMFHHGGSDQGELIGWTLQHLPLTTAPGQKFAYSNFGFCVLGRVIEQVTGQPYQAAVQALVLGPCGIGDMKIGGNKERQRAPNEVVYYGQYGEDPYKANLERMDANAGWIACANDLVIFLDHVGGAPGIASLLQPATLKQMTTPSHANPGYARGWAVDAAAGTWWHIGSMPGSEGVMLRSAKGTCWAALANSRSQPAAQMDQGIEEMMWSMVRCAPGWGM